MSEVPLKCLLPLRFKGSGRGPVTTVIRAAELLACEWGAGEESIECTSRCEWEGESG